MGEVYFLKKELKDWDSCLERQRLIGYITAICKHHQKIYIQKGRTSKDFLSKQDVRIDEGNNKS